MQIIPVAARDHVPEYVVRRVKEMLNDNLEHEVCTDIIVDFITLLYNGIVQNSKPTSFKERTDFQMASF